MELAAERSIPKDQYGDPIPLVLKLSPKKLSQISMDWDDFRE